MSTVNISQQVFSTHKETEFKREKNQMVIFISVISTIVIFVVETVLMIFLEYLIQIPKLWTVIIDGLMLITILLPLNYYFIVLPMSGQIDKNRKINLELGKSSEMLERFFSINDVLIAYLDSSYNIRRVNFTYANANQGEPGAFIGRNHFDIFPAEGTREIFDTVVRTGKAFSATETSFNIRTLPNHEVNYWDWNLFPIKDEQGNVIELLLTLNNVTSRKKTQQALLDSERRFRAVFNQTFQHIAMLNPDGNILVANQTLLDFTGMIEPEIHGLPLWQVPWWQTADSKLMELQTAIKKAAAGDVIRSELTIRAENGGLAIVDTTIKPLLDEKGKTILLIYEARDITERIEAAEALQRSEDQIKTLYDAEKQAHHFAETLRSVGLDLYRSLNSNTVLETLLAHLNKVVPFKSAHILRFIDEDNLVVRMANGEETWDPEFRLIGKSFDINELANLKPLLKDTEIISVPDTTLAACPLLFPRTDYVQSWIGIPLLAGEQTIGVCILEHPDTSFFTEKLIYWSTALTSQAAIAIQNAWLFERVRDNRERLQALSRRLVEVQEMERHYIAQELHDEAGQALASLMVGLRLIEGERNDPNAVAARTIELKQIADGVLENLHRLAMDLRPATLDHLGLVAALRQHTQMVGERHGLSIQFEAVGKITRLPGESETAIYRIVQEALTNIVRHAKATRADVLLEKRKNCLVLVIEDNGIGFDPQTPKMGQLGMLGMRERADMLGGSLIIESSPEQGTTVMLEIPWPSES